MEAHQEAHLIASVERIERAVIGDEKFGHRGLIHRMDDVETDVRRVDKKTERLHIKVIGVSAFTAGVVATVKALFGK